MKILLFGKNGQVGWELQRSLAPLGELVTLGSSRADLPCDFRFPEALARTVESVRPDVIVNAAAYTAVDKAESDQEAARLVNASSPGVLARAAHACGALLVHYSTDYVFDGQGARAYLESDTPRPLSVYGATKLEGEQLIARNCARHLIFRTSWVYASRGRNFAKTILKLAKERDRLSVVNDQFGAPTGADLLADVTAHAIRNAVRDSSRTGLFHLAAAGETTWHGYAQFLLREAESNGVAMKTRPEALEAVSTQAFPTAARRPTNSRLDTARVRSVFELELPSWESGVSRLINEIVSQEST
jgi:dTDP-4-dehydrorhamnose reductase